MKHRFFISLLLGIMLFTQCGRQSTEGELRTVFKYNESAGITSLDPAFARNQANIWGVNQLFNGLVQLDDSLNILPCIAKNWDISADGRTYTFYLRDDVYFHENELFKNPNKRKVIASDFVFSFNRIIDENLASPGAWVFNNVLINDDHTYSFRAPDDTTFIVTLREAFPPFLGLLSMQYCSVVPYEVVEHYGKEFRKNPVGTGPFRFKIWKEGIKLVFVKNPNYFEVENGTRLPYLDAVAITFIVDKQTAFLEFVKGNIDFLSGIDMSYKDELLTRNGTLNSKYNDRLNLTKSPYLNTEYLGFLVDSALPLSVSSPLSDVRVRQAINYGFDRSKMILYLRNNIGQAALSGMIPAGMPAFNDSLTQGYYYAPDKARQLLAEAGYPNGNGLPIITLSTNPSYLDLCQYIQSELKEIGINIKIDVLPPATLREMIARSDVNFFRGSWIADYPDAENYLSLFYSKNYAPAGPNYTHFKDGAFDALYEKAITIVNDEERYSLYRQMDSIVLSHAPVVLLYYDEVLRFSQKNIEGLGNNPLNLLTLKRVRKLN
ncbi:MAG: ABC transporter substrate-binding protein [Bacteroidales bacterium]|nr:ABC transporter substrate-binding protein [Bacteroidales bacterium]